MNWSWVCAGYCDMAFSFEVGERIDTEVLALTEGEFASEGFKPWGGKDGHKKCKKAHYLLVKE